MIGTMWTEYGTEPMEASMSTFKILSGGCREQLVCGCPSQGSDVSSLAY